MADYEKCFACGAQLHDDDRALYRKLVLRNADEFLCLDCQAGRFNTTRAKLEALIERFRQYGNCGLFK